MSKEMFVEVSNDEYSTENYYVFLLASPTGLGSIKMFCSHFGKLNICLTDLSREMIFSCITIDRKRENAAFNKFR